MRAFVALEVPAGVLDAVFSFQRELAGVGADIRLVGRENLHFTLKFLGEISDADAQKASSRLAALSISGGTAEVRGAGAFPNLSGPRVVWAGVAKDDEEKVVSIARGVESALAGLGEQDSRPFRPHLTVARVRSGRNVDRLAELIRSNSDRAFGSASFTEFKLKSSNLTSSGPEYSDVGVFPLI